MAHADVECMLAGRPACGSSVVCARTLQRLQALKVEGAEKKRAAAGATGSVLDQPVNYSSPPSLSDTLLSQLNSDVSDPKLRNAQFGPNQLAVAAGDTPLAAAAPQACCPAK